LKALAEVVIRFIRPCYLVGLFLLMGVAMLRECVIIKS